MLCRTYEFIRDAVPVDKLLEILETTKKSPNFRFDEFIKEHICARCDFLVDGCDYAEGKTSPPCGGYTVVEILKERGII